MAYLVYKAPQVSLVFLAWMAVTELMDLLEILGHKESKAPEVTQDLLVKRVKRENLLMLAYFRKDRKENQD